MEESGSARRQKLTNAGASQCGDHYKQGTSVNYALAEAADSEQKSDVRNLQQVQNIWKILKAFRRK